VEPSPQAKQQTPQASDLDAVIRSRLPTTGELGMETFGSHATGIHRREAVRSADGSGG
jgi:hypothetical protein